MNVKALICALLLPLPALGQGFAGLGGTAEGYALPDPAARLEFPRDHGAHPGFRIEWWYVTANLEGEDGKEYGIQWTLFRSALAPGDPGTGWQNRTAWMGHAAVTSADTHKSAERLARGGIGQAGVTLAPFRAEIDDWHLVSTADPGADPLSAARLGASGTGFAYDLDLVATGPLVLQGARGYSVKSRDGQASHYYSQPFYRAEGRLIFPDRTVRVTGRAWLDREWSSQPLAADQTGWDWLSLHLDGGAKLMVFRLRGAGDDFLTGTWIAPDGTPAPLPPGAVEMIPKAETQLDGRSIPTLWQIRLPARGLDITVTALQPGAWNATRVPYWEGPVTARGSHPGEGYLEMTGY
ncbi:putative secreted hydrolase [Rhodovulum sulfidophilum]|uniref:lipocalin-like domain-containing protein n=1 Tax=Rhodovulum sulfidophilum TaxID=35806 RepID=UPI0005A5D324|nr:lipocalin-like domain-containing protein [Rhodovulum sulfidophilum]ANB33662.1 iron ABC transporter permease [Rhodovulum sulfidophilum DSM 1374]ANB37483.1 iron ABC transporter permease [Rhodovulum sulfidophilum]MCW2302995.1 putative secreted hydrolase [Rhodovulum sulfidophilum]